MNAVETSTPYQKEDDVIRLKLEYSALLEEVDQNNRHIHEIQIRDLESLESMKYHMARKRELNERIRQLKKLILERYVDRQGSKLKIDDWMAGLQISSSSPGFMKLPEDNLFNSLDQFCNNDVHIGDINDTIEQSTENLLAQLSFKIEKITKSVNSSGRCDPLLDETQSRSESSVSAARQNDMDEQKTKMDNQTAFLLQHLKKSDSSILSPMKLSPSSLGSEQHQSVLQSTSRKRFTASNQTHPTHRLNYPTNVELRSVKSPPVLPHKRKTFTTFTTKHNLSRKEAPPSKTPGKHKHVGDYMVHNRNLAAAPMTSFSSGAAPRSQTTFGRIIWTVVIITSVSLLFYMYPSLLNCLLLLKDGAKQTPEELTRILDSIIVTAGGDPWWNSPAESEMSSSSLIGLSQQAAEQDQSTWQAILDYATAIYRYILYD